MKRLLLVIGIVLTPLMLFAQGTVYVNPYVQRDGTQVQGHYRTAPNNTTLDNWSTRGNTNPYTGREGTVTPYSYPSYNTNSNLHQYPSLYSPRR